MSDVALQPWVRGALQAAFALAPEPRQTVRVVSVGPTPQGADQIRTQPLGSLGPTWLTALVDHFGGYIALGATTLVPTLHFTAGQPTPSADQLLAFTAAWAPTANWRVDHHTSTELVLSQPLEVHK